MFNLHTCRRENIFIIVDFARPQEGEAVKFVEELAAEVGSRLQALGMKGRTLTLKLKVRRPDAPVETAKYLGR